MTECLKNLNLVSKNVNYAAKCIESIDNMRHTEPREDYELEWRKCLMLLDECKVCLSNIENIYARNVKASYAIKGI